MTVASSVAQGLHCASLLRWVESEEDVNKLCWIVNLFNLVIYVYYKGYFTGHPGHTNSSNIWYIICIWYRMKGEWEWEKYNGIMVNLD